MYDRGVKGAPEPGSGLRYRIETLIGITGYRMTKYRASWKEAIMSQLDIVWRPHMLGILIFEVSLAVPGTAVTLTFTGTRYLVRFWDWYEC